VKLTKYCRQSHWLISHKVKLTKYCRQSHWLISHKVKLTKYCRQSQLYAKFINMEIKTMLDKVLYLSFSVEILNLCLFRFI